MPENLTRKVEFLANVAIIVVAILVCVVLFKTYVLKSTDKQQPETSLVGKKVPVSDVDWQKNGQTLLLVLQKGCHYCTESAPFYERLVRDAASRGGRPRLVAVVPQQVEEGRQYLKDLGITVDEVKQVTPASLGVRGTPTLILVNEAGMVTGHWMGKLPPDKEDEVLNRLKS